MTTTLTELSIQVAAIARQAGEAILEIYKDESRFNVEAKGDASPLTAADKAANAIICDALAALAVQYPIVSEENKEIPYAERKGFEHFWLVDPLDGTKEFIKRNGEFTVNIALVRGQEVVMGVVHTPVMGETFRAAAGEGAFVEKDGQVQPLSAAKFSRQDSGLKIVMSRSHLNAETEAFVSQFAEPEAVSKGSSLKLLMVAEGVAHVYPRLAPTMEWDTAAAQIVVEEAGGQVLNHETGSKLLYNKEVLLNPYFVVYGQVQD